MRALECAEVRRRVARLARGWRAGVMREGLPTIRIRTFDGEGNLTGEVLLDPSAARTAAANLEVALENLGMLIDATGGVHHGGAIRLGTDDGSLELAWTESGKFD